MSRQDPGEKTAVSQPKEVPQPSKEGKKVSAQSTWLVQRETEPLRELGQNGKLGGAGAVWFLQTESGQSSIYLTFTVQSPGAKARDGGKINTVPTP